ncbi:MAG: OmpH family outer membrane protein [Candidatus Aerophobetes bacterium]|nr:OmpH family outer membrane protein [Candidatus Aerophobetes bacterium]
MEFFRKGYLLLFVFSLIFLLVMTAGKAKADLVVKPAYVDTQKIFQEYDKKKDLESRLNTQLENERENLRKKREELENKRRELELLQEELKTKESLLTDIAKEEKLRQIEEEREELQDLGEELQDLSASIEKSLRMQEEEYTEQIRRDISNAVKRVAEREGYRFVFHKEALIYATPEPEFDLTEKVLSLLNQEYQP